MELKGFQRVTLQPGESKTVSFTITPDLLSMLNAEMKRIVEPGAFTIMIGASSRDIRLKEGLMVE
jgi:beta-glucosidase